MLIEHMPFSLKEMTALGTESTIAIQGGLPSEQLTMTQQRGSERWIDRERRFGRDTQTAKKDFQKCHRGTDEQRPTISERLLKWSEKIRISIGNNQKLYFTAKLRDCGREFQLCNIIRERIPNTQHSNLSPYVSGGEHPCLPWTRPFAAEIDAEQCVFLTMTTSHWRNKAWVWGYLCEWHGLISKMTSMATMTQPVHALCCSPFKKQLTSSFSPTHCTCLVGQVMSGISSQSTGSSSCVRDRQQFSLSLSLIHTYINTKAAFIWSKIDKNSNIMKSKNYLK